MITAFERERMHSRITEVYAFLCQCAGEAVVKRVPVLELIEPSPLVAAEMLHNPRRQVGARVLRDFFSPPQSVPLSLPGMPGLVSAHTGLQAAIVLGHAREAVLTGVVETQERQIEYGVDKLGPFRFTTFRKIRFLRRKVPLLERVSFEELCLYTEQPHDTVSAVFHLLDTTVTSLLPSKR